MADKSLKTGFVGFFKLSLRTRSIRSGQNDAFKFVLEERDDREGDKKIGKGEEI